jgi:hypothetical protein
MAAASGPVVPGPPPAPLWKRVAPFVVALALVAFVASRLDLDTFVAELLRVDYASYLAFAAAFVIGLLSADTLATVLIYRRTVARVRYRDFFVVRGASYLPSLLNHHLGQVFLTYFMARAYRVTIQRVAGATLLTYATWTGCLLGMAILALFLSGDAEAWGLVALGAGLAYLVVIAARPRALAKNGVLAPLFDAGVSGHLLALVARVPHFVVLFLGSWIPFRFFGVNIPIEEAIKLVPVLMVAVTLPITPHGVGTRDLLAATFFEAFAAGATHEERLAALAAATTSWAVASTLFEALVGLVLMRKALPRIAPGALAEEAEVALPASAPAPGEGP